MPQTLNELQHAFSLAIEPCVVSMHTGHGGRVHYLLFSLKKLYMLIPDLSEALQLILGSWTTLLIIIFTPQSEILRGAPGRARFMVKLCSFHFRIMAPTVHLAKVLRKLFAFTHHEMFLETPFYRPSVGTEPANIHFHWRGAGLRSNYW